MNKQVFLISLTLLLALLVAQQFTTLANKLTLVRVTVINKSGHVVYLKMQGTDTDAFYYIVIKEGTKLEPSVKVYRIVVDEYQRTTWSCDGIKSEGTLAITRNMRLIFASCGDITPPPPSEVEEEGKG